jgi:hypothetical protein
MNRKMIGEAIYRRVSGNLYRVHFIDASYQVLVHFICPSGFREDFLEIDQSEKDPIR